MNSRERFLAALKHEEADRVPMHDSPWAATIKRWREEGLTTETSPAEYYGFGMVRFEADTSPQFPVRIIEEDEEYILRVHRDGRLMHEERFFAETAGGGREHMLRLYRPGRHYYYLEVASPEAIPNYPSNVAHALGARAWSSPIWVDTAQ